VARAATGTHNDWSRPPHFGPQNALLTILVLTELDGVTKPALQVLQRK
jgi:tripeptide aminopeptidase